MRTAFTDLLALRQPIALAPMGGAAGGALAAAVSQGGGLGLVGGGIGDRDWLDRELAIVTEHTKHTEAPWGVGFLCWGVDVPSVEHALTYRPSAVLLSFGDPAPFVPAVREAGATLIVQVTDLDEARRAVEVGADVLVAQGTESGGHGAARGLSTLPFVPVVADLAAPAPVLAAGGIADGRGIAAALALGAAGAMLGTRFLATQEALVDPAAVKAILDARGADTERSRVLDIARGSAWPSRYTGRSLRHPLIDEWRHREEQLADDADARRDYTDALAAGTQSPPVWAGQGLDLITDLPTAADLVGVLAAQAEEAVRRAATSLD